MARHAPGVGALGPAIERFDEWADAQLERVRGTPVADQVFETASRLGDFSVVWHLLNVTRGVVGGPRRRRQIPVLALLIGAESLLVNQGIKRLFDRQRPTVDGDDRFDGPHAVHVVVPVGPRQRRRVRRHHAHGVGRSGEPRCSGGRSPPPSPRRAPTSASTTRPTCSPGWPWA